LRHQGQSILVFTHGGVLDKLYRFITGLPLSAARNFGIPNAGLKRIEVTPAGWQIRSWADVTHLERALDDLPE
jgi:probable phosphoglycerate mutase